MNTKDFRFSATRSGAPLARSIFLGILSIGSSAFAQSGGGYVIRKSTMNAGVEVVSGAQYRLSGTTGQHDAGDLVGGGYKLFGGFWSPTQSPPAAPLADPTGIDKVRYLSFEIPSSPTGATVTALQVKLVSLMHPDPPNLPQFSAPDFTAQEGTARYVGTPGDCQETEVPPTTFKCASLQCTPVYMDWEAALGGQTLHVTGQAVVPSSKYEVRLLAASCQGNESTCMTISSPLTINTQRWGDVSATFQTPSPAPLTQPNITDVSACVDKFKGVPTVIFVARADVNPAVPNERVDIADVANIVDAFKNLAYPFLGPTVCP